MLNLLPSPRPVSQKSKQSKENLHFTSHKNQDRPKQNAAAPTSAPHPSSTYPSAFLSPSRAAASKCLFLCSSCLLCFSWIWTARTQCTEVIQPGLPKCSVSLEQRYSADNRERVVYKEDEDARGSYTQMSALSHLSTAEAAKVTQSSSPQTVTQLCTNTPISPSCFWQLSSRDLMFQS